VASRHSTVRSQSACASLLKTSIPSHSRRHSCSPLRQRSTMRGPSFLPPRPPLCGTRKSTSCFPLSWLLLATFSKDRADGQAPTTVNPRQSSLLHGVDFLWRYAELYFFCVALESYASLPPDGARIKDPREAVFPIFHRPLTTLSPPHGVFSPMFVSGRC